MSSTYGYIDARAATSEYQIKYYGILSFSTNNALGPVNFIIESGSASHGTKPILAGIVNDLLRGDTLVVIDFLALGSTTTQILSVLSSLSRRGIKLYLVNGGFRLDDNAQAQVVTAACSLLAQVESELESFRPAQKVAQGPPTDLVPAQSRPRIRKSRLDGREEEIQSMLQSGAPLAQIARAVETNRQTVSDFISSRNLAT